MYASSAGSQPRVKTTDRVSWRVMPESGRRGVCAYRNRHSCSERHSGRKFENVKLSLKDCKRACSNTIFRGMDMHEGSGALAVCEPVDPYFFAETSSSLKKITLDISDVRCPPSHLDIKKSDEYRGVAVVYANGKHPQHSLHTDIIPHPPCHRLFQTQQLDPLIQIRPS